MGARRFARSVLPALLAAVIVGACGGDDDDEGRPAATGDFQAASSEEQREISAVLRRLASEDEPRAICRDVFTPGLVRRLFLSAAQCLRANDDVEAGAGESVRASRIEVDGDRARAEVELALGTVRVQGGIELRQRSGCSA